MSKKLKTIAAVLGAAATGAAIGILLAPDKGSKTRAKLRKGLDDAAHNLKDSISEKSKFLSKKDTHAKENLDATSGE